MRRIPASLVLCAGLLLALSPMRASAQEPAPSLDQGRGALALPRFGVVPAPASATRVSGGPAARTDSGLMPNQVQYFVHPEDVSTVGSQCVGLDCTGAEAFGFDTIRMKENNTRIKFEDTSVSAGFAAKDWQLTANESQQGGLDKFSIDNVSDSRTPFTVLGDAVNNALYLSEWRAGFGTTSPVLTLHSSFGDSPGLRLDQTSASGYSPYVWDVSGNESNFFVRDVTGGGTLPLRIMPGAGANSIVSTSAGIGLGTLTPGARLHLVNSAPTIRATNSSTGTTTLSLDANGNLTLSGLLFESSSRTVKENLRAIDGDVLLERVSRLPLYHWNYKTDEPSVTHVGPVAEDFADAFGLGKDEAHIAALDASGVALGAIQALARQNQAKDAKIGELEARLGEQAAALEHLRSELKTLMDRVEAR